MKKMLLLLSLIFCYTEIMVAQYVEYPVSILYAKDYNKYIVGKARYYTDACGLMTATFGLVNWYNPETKKYSYMSEAYNVKSMVMVKDTLFYIDACYLYWWTPNKKDRFKISYQQNPNEWEPLKALAYSEENRILYFSSLTGIFKFDLDSIKLKFYKFGDSLKAPNGIYWDKDKQRLIVLNAELNKASIMEFNPADSTIKTILKTNIKHGYGLTRDSEGSFYVSDWNDDKYGNGKVYKLDKELKNAPVEIAKGYSQPCYIFYNKYSDSLAIPNTLAVTIEFLNLAPEVPKIDNIGLDGKPVSTKPRFSWRKSLADSYHLQVAISKQIAEKEIDNPQADEFDNPILDINNIKDTSYTPTIAFESNVKYIWRVMGNYGSRISGWSKVLNFTPGVINGVEDEISNDLEILPNPATDYITIQNSILTKEEINFEIFNLYGQKIIPTSSLSYDLLQDGNFKIDVSNLTPGVYFIRIGDKFEKFLKL